jgi:hypothetical protein
LNLSKKKTLSSGCFFVFEGDIEDFPGLDSLPCFKTTLNEDDDSVTITAEKGLLEKPKRVRLAVKYDGSSDDGDVVVIGSGGAGATCAEQLRYNGFSGLIVLVTQDEHLPYDRPKLSKALSSKPEEIALRSSDFYEVCSRDSSVVCLLLPPFFRDLIQSQRISLILTRLVHQCFIPSDSVSFQVKLSQSFFLRCKRFTSGPRDQSDEKADRARAEHGTQEGRAAERVERDQVGPFVRESVDRNWQPVSWPNDRFHLLVHSPQVSCDFVTL